MVSWFLATCPSSWWPWRPSWGAETLSHLSLSTQRPGRQQGQGGCLHGEPHKPGQTPSRNTHPWGKAKVEVTEFLLRQFPPPRSISGKQSGIRIPTVIKKNQNPTSQVWNSGNWRHGPLRAEKGWQILLEIQSAKNVKGNYLKNSNLPCATGLFFLVYHKQNWLHLIIYLPILRELGQNSK